MGGSGRVTPITVSPPAGSEDGLSTFPEPAFLAPELPARRAATPPKVAPAETRTISVHGADEGSNEDPLASKKADLASWIAVPFTPSKPIVKAGAGAVGSEPVSWLQAAKQDLSGCRGTSPVVALQPALDGGLQYGDTSTLPTPDHPDQGIHACFTPRMGWASYQVRSK